MPSGEILRLSDDKSYIMQEMRKSMQNSIDNAAWPDAQYLWAIHPVISWLNDKTGLLIGRGEAPVIGVKNFMQTNESIFVVEGSMPNERSAALVDDMFGVRYFDGKFVEFLDINAVVNKTKINSELDNVFVGKLLVTQYIVQTGQKFHTDDDIITNTGGLGNDKMVFV